MPMVSRNMMMTLGRRLLSATTGGSAMPSCCCFRHSHTLAATTCTSGTTSCVALQLPWPVRSFGSSTSRPPPPRANQQPKQHQVLTLDEKDLDESFVKGWGKGGQKINKVRNCVLLKHIPTGFYVRCQETRRLEDNRRIARKLLLQKLDDHVNGENSRRNLKIDKLRKKKARKSAKSKKKYATEPADPNHVDDDDEADEADEEEGPDHDDDKVTMASDESEPDVDDDETEKQA